MDLETAVFFPLGLRVIFHAMVVACTAFSRKDVCHGLALLLYIARNLLNLVQQSSVMCFLETTMYFAQGI